MKDGYLFVGGIAVFILGLFSLLSFLYLPQYLYLFLPIFGYIGIVLLFIGLILTYVGIFRKHRRIEREKTQEKQKEDNGEQWDIIDADFIV